MPKFYVTSGQVREIVTAEDAEGAAATAMDRFFEPHAWVLDTDEFTDHERRAHLAVEALTHLDFEFRVSQIGFHNHQDVEHFSTADLLDIHFRLALALRRFAAMVEIGEPVCCR